MQRTTIYLPEDLKQGLERLASLTRRSEAELVREALANLLEAHPSSTRPKLAPIVASADTLAHRVDALLAEGFGLD